MVEKLVTIAKIHNDFPTKFGIPRQSNLVEGLSATVVFEPDFRVPEALRGLCEFSHIWLLWGFSEAKRETWSPTVRPPRLGGNARVGVFASRSPYRPNAIGLSSVRLVRIETSPSLGPILHVLGADMMDGTPIYDIKPYLPYVDCLPNASGGFAAEAPASVLHVEAAQEQLSALPQGKRQVLLDLLAKDPRPSYHDDPGRVYGFVFAGCEIKFTVKEKTLKILEVTEKNHRG
ncbi:tRNA (N6-threonylcarbamoyladenosine(37)-N6)-methyltransferase TrmO [Ruminococcaceae bacterium OttesenSCG-928-I18]|nr:tRNA (N6-threonylcarbamoyladenosine(37)-N6)-methyltransferase TrmO [Ruminococcaceae bacterium OttesenSCG-928-I18]